MSKNLVVNFTTNELKSLIDDKTSCVTVHKSVYNLQLYPYHLTDISASIKELLNAKIAKYDQKLDGILLGYKNLKLLTPQGSILCDSCYIHIDIEGNFYIFKPEIGSLLTGIVSKKSDNHVACLVHRLFNVSVPKNDDESWLGHHVNIGDEVIVRVVFLDLEARLPYIKTEFVSKKSKKKVKKEDNDIEETNDFISDETFKKKKNKKNKFKTLDHDDYVSNKIEVEDKKKMKKDKRNNYYTENENSVELNESIKKKEKIKKEKKIDCIVENRESTELDESFKKKKKIKKEEKNSLILENEKSTKLKESSNSFITENEDTTEFNESFKKKKKKIKESDLETTFNTEISPKKKKHKDSKNVKELEKLNGLDTSDKNSETKLEITKLKKSSKEKKENRKSEELKQKMMMHSLPKTMADAEDRKTKKRKSSITPNIVWDNKELNLYDSDLEKILKGSSTKSVDSPKFNLVKITALNDDNPRKRTSDSLTDFVEPDKKRKRKSSENFEQSKPKKQKTDTVEPKKQKSKKLKEEIENNNENDKVVKKKKKSKTKD